MRQETEGTCPRARWLACTFATPFKVPRSRRPRRRDMTRAAAEHEERVAVRAAVDARRGSAQGAAASSADKPPQGAAVVGGVRARLATEAAPRSSRGRCHGGSTISPTRAGSAGPAHASTHRADVDGPRRGADGGRVPHQRARVHPAVGANGARHPSGIRAPLVGEMVDADRHDDGGDSRLAGSRRELAQLHGRRRGCAPTVLLV